MRQKPASPAKMYTQQCDTRADARSSFEDIRNPEQLGDGARPGRITFRHRRQQLVAAPPTSAAWRISPD